MKNIFAFLVFISLISCNKDKETVSDIVVKDSLRTSTFDSIQIPTFQNAELTAPFEIAPQNIQTEKGRAIFSKEGKVLFYFDQDLNSGTIKIDGKDYVLNQVDFNENNYKLSGKEVQIEATNGEFTDDNSECISGTFADAKVIFNQKTLNLTNLLLKDCPAF